MLLASLSPGQYWHLLQWPYKSSWMCVTLSLLVTLKGTQVSSRCSVCSWSPRITAFCCLVKSELYTQSPQLLPCWPKLHGNPQRLWEMKQPSTSSEGGAPRWHMDKEGGKKERAYNLARPVSRTKSGCPEWLHNLQSSAQKENVGPCLSKSIKNFKTATVEHKLNGGPFPRAGPCVTAQVTDPWSLSCRPSVVKPVASLPNQHQMGCREQSSERNK